MFNKILKFNLYSALLATLCLFHLAGNIIWLNLNKVPLAWDQAGHTIITFNFTDFFNKPSGDFLSISDYYPPFVHLVVAFFMLIFGRNVSLGPLVVTGFFLLAIIFLYLYTYQLFKNRLTALLSAFLFSFLPNMYYLSREFLLEIPLLSMVLGSLYFLEKSDNFQRKKYTVLFGIFLGLAFAIKWTAVIFILIPVSVKLIKIFPSFPWKNLLLALGIILAINSTWYLHNLPVILHAAKFTAVPETADPQKILSYESFKFYPFLMTNFQLTWFGALVFLMSLFYFTLKKRNYLLPTLIFVYLAFTLIGNKDLRYIIFLAPIATVVIAYFLSTFKNKVLAGILTSLLISYYIFYYFTLSFGWPLNPDKLDFRRSIQIPAFGWIDLINLGKDTSRYLAPTYNPTIWPNTLIAKELSKHNPDKNIKILVLCEKPYLNQVNMELTRKQLGLNKIQFVAPYELTPFSQDKLLEKYLLGFDVILVVDKDLGYGGGIRHFAALKQMSGYLQKNKSANLIKINSYPLPDADNLDVYKPTQDPL